MLEPPCSLCGYGFWLTNEEQNRDMISCSYCRELVRERKLLARLEATNVTLVAALQQIAAIRAEDVTAPETVSSTVRMIAETTLRQITEGIVVQPAPADCWHRRE